MNQYYGRLMALKEAEEFKPVAEKWRILSENIKSSPFDAPILLPDMLWIAKPGVGRSNLLYLMTEYLAELGNIMDFYGDVKYFEFLMEYCAPSERFEGLNRLIDAVNNAAGFRNEFRGVIHIDITEWKKHYEENYFITLMEYLADNSDKWLIVLSVIPSDDEDFHNLEAFLSMFLRIERIALTLPKTGDLFDSIEKHLDAYGLSLEDDAKQLLTDSIEELRQSRYFDGFKTIKLLCQDIVYSVFSKQPIESYHLTKDMLQDFAADSDYVKRTVTKFEKVHLIGFREGM